jgi:hypothetical protein
LTEEFSLERLWNLLQLASVLRVSSSFRSFPFFRLLEDFCHFRFYSSLSLAPQIIGNGVEEEGKGQGKKGRQGQNGGGRG